MENNQEDDQDDFIESSQVPTLRSKIRQQRPNYRERPYIHKKEETYKKGKKKSSKRLLDNKTVSQCLWQAWKNPLNKPSPVATIVQPASVNNVALEEEYIKFPTQQEAPNCEIQPMPSVSLFAQQDEALARYISNENTEAQVEAQLQKLLDGFQAEYEKKCADMERSPVSHAEAEHASASQATLLPGAGGVSEGMEANERQQAFSPLPMLSEPFIMPNFSEELQQLQEMMENDKPLRSNPSPLPAPVTPSIIIPIPELGRAEEIPQIENAKVANPIATRTACLDLSIQKEQCIVENANRAQTSKKVVEERPQFSNLAPRVNDILDLRIKNSPFATSQRVTNFTAPTIVPYRPHITHKSDCGTQTKLRPKTRNVGIQHRPVASMELTNRNLIVLAQQFEADPHMLQRKMKRIAKTSTEAIWRERDLSTVFTMADPYYANLKHFL